MPEIIHHAIQIDDILQAPNLAKGKILFDRYTFLPSPEEKEAFILALIGKVLLIQAQLEAKE